MVALASPFPTKTRRQPRPQLLLIRKEEVVGVLMDAETRAFEARDANGAVLQYLLLLPRDAAVEQAIDATHVVNQRVKELLDLLKEAAGDYDTRASA